MILKIKLKSAAKMTLMPWVIKLISMFKSSLDSHEPKLKLPRFLCNKSAPSKVKASKQDMLMAQLTIVAVLDSLASPLM